MYQDLNIMYQYLNIFFTSLKSPKIMIFDLNLPFVKARAVEYNRRVESVRQF